MPSHIFTRVGYWKESVAANTASGRPPRPATKPTINCTRMDYLVYAYLQLGQDTKREAIIDEMRGGQRIRPRRLLPALLRWLSSPARYVIERGDWTLRRVSGPAEQFAYVDAITYFTRAIGAARCGKSGGRESGHRKICRNSR